MPAQDLIISLNKDEDTVSFIEAELGNTVKKVDVGHHPHEIGITPDGLRSYVSNAMGNTVSVIDNESMTELERLEHPDWFFPHDIKISPDGKKLYLAVTYTHKVYVYELPSHDLIKEIPTKQRVSHMLAPTPDFKRIYVPNIQSNTCSVLNTATDEIEMHLSVGKGPEGVAVHPFEPWLYVANQDENNIYVFSTENHGVIAKHPIGNTPVRMVFSPDGKYAFVPNRTSHDLSIIECSRHWEIKRIPTGRWPGGVVFNPAGTKAYVANNKTNDISVIELASLTEIGRIEAGIHPDGIGYLPAS